MHGRLGNYSDININYLMWGKSGSLSINKVDQKDVISTVDQISKFADLKQLTLTHCAKVQHYQGKAENPIVWLRFEPLNAKFGGLGKKHISFTIDSKTKQLKGFMDMLSTKNDNPISHQEALETAIIFLRKEAPDLIDSMKEIPLLNDLPRGSLMEFPAPYIDYDNVQFRWIGIHKEVLFKTEQEVRGMKIKMYLPKTGNWCWVIVNHFNQVITFERDICWDFDAMCRKTQMWLHDRWLLANNIGL